MGVHLTARTRPVGRWEVASGLGGTGDEDVAPARGRVPACRRREARRQRGPRHGQALVQVVEQLLFFYLPALSSVQTTPVHPPGRFLPAGDELVYVCTPLRPVVARMDVRTRYLISGVFLLLSASGARMVLC